MFFPANYLFDTQKAKKFNSGRKFFAFHFLLFAFFRNFAHYFPSAHEKIGIFMAHALVDTLCMQG